MTYIPDKFAILSAKSLTEAKTLLTANVKSIESDTSVECVDCENCQRCVLCSRCGDCTDCRDCEDCSGCKGCSSLVDGYDCTKCFGADGAPAKMLRDCKDCVYVERAILVVGERGTASARIRNRFGYLQLTSEEFDILWALPLEPEPPVIEG
jgi:hypothetical protein